MINVNQFMKQISAHGYTKEKLAEKMGMEVKIFGQKLKGAEDCFTIREANRLVEILKLEGREAEKIFFE
ncbi:hypothetical protein CLNEO_17230 [Anaerotignum neopropionicum]|uniref:HTH cro/C1-type domain-containing protein n=1 Tax=Anaerotignum neopropionicum TaxID=36847 RepID=A0A136WDV7_9FIRM|nr:hypothetical protein [Anaerotignum neopropionicum]KXL52702.1 hypothetical protein CLNEO_17230 [Anaerotignum neopropionicum]